MSSTDGEDNDLFWHVLNYRTAETLQAERAWLGLVACVNRLVEVGRDTSSASCRWTLDDDESIWNTECGNGFYLDRDSPESRGMKCCCFCGKTISN